VRTNAQHPAASALQYIQWRYAIGEDREALTKVNRKTTDEDQKSMDAVHGELQGARFRV
jgi:hypothetical protein